MPICQNVNKHWQKQAELVAQGGAVCLREGPSDFDNPCTKVLAVLKSGTASIGWLKMQHILQRCCSQVRNPSCRYTVDSWNTWQSHPSHTKEKQKRGKQVSHNAFKIFYHFTSSASRIAGLWVDVCRLRNFLTYCCQNLYW